MVDDESFKDKIKSVGSLLRKGQKKVTPVEGEHGERAGEHIEHWDGRVDAVARPQTIQVTTSVRKPEE